jgi:hypothetical protein
LHIYLLLVYKYYTLKRGYLPNAEKPNGEKPNGEKPNGEKPNGVKENVVIEFEAAEVPEDPFALSARTVYV